MNSEYARFKTFETHGWPSLSPVTPRDLAAAGMYYTGQGDKVACFACHGCLNNWEAGDIPIQEHKRVFPKCPYVLGQFCGNVPLEIGHNSPDSIPSTLPNFSIKSPPPDVVATSKLGIPASGRLIHPMDLVTATSPTPDVLRTCQHRNYAMENQRLESFRRWPSRSPMKPSILARAGFFYSGWLFQ